MGILLALGAGKLWSRDSPPPCPLERVDLIAAGGALLLLLADLVSRVLIAPVILPVGAITSFLGAPVFLYLLLKGGAARA